MNSILSLTDWSKNNLKLGLIKLIMFLLQINVFIASDCEFAARVNQIYSKGDLTN
jgi:hypothetical protein